MNDNAKKWVEALRSGEFSQTQNTLRDQNVYCCLGVGAELAVREGIIPPSTVDEIGVHCYDGDRGILTSTVWSWLGLLSPTGRYDSEEEDPTQLSQLNDLGASFETIADLIESEPEGLFV